MDPASKKTLDLLPEELVSNIAARLHADDIAAFRLVSRSVEQKSFHEFATEYFTEKCFMFTSDSLKVLVAIAKSDRLRSYLRHIHFMTAIFSERAFKCPRGCQCSWQPSTRQREAFRGYIEDQKILQSTKRDSQLLAEAFGNLPNLSSLSVDDSPSMLPVNVDYRGNNKVPRLCGRPPMYAPHAATDEGFKEYDTFFGHIWEVVVQAMEHTVALTHFAAHLGKSSNGVPIAFLDSTKFPKSMPAFKSLNALLLCIRGDERADLTDNRNLNEITEYELTVLHKLAKGLPSLQVLDLAFDSSRPTGSYLIALTTGLQLSALTTVYLDGLAINATALVGILRRLTAVKNLRLIFTNIMAGSWISVLKALQNMTRHLQHLHLMYLLEAGRKVYFLKQNEEDLQDPFFDRPDGSDSDFDDGDYTDDDLPPLEPGDMEILGFDHPNAQRDDAMDFTANETSGPGQTSIPIFTDAPTTGPTTASIPAGHSNVNHSRPGDFDGGERGYFVCLQGEQIAEQLPTFIQEYNLGEDVEEAIGMPPFPGGAPPPVINNFVHMLGAALGVPGVPPVAGNNVVGGVTGTAMFPNPNGGTTTIPFNVPPFGPHPAPPAAAPTSDSNASGTPDQGMESNAALDVLWNNIAEDEWEHEEEMSDLD